MNEANTAERPVIPLREWVTYNHKIATYDTPDGTSIPEELVDNAQCLADVLHIAIMREKQRAAMRHNAKANHES